jgi:murein DD-endopeptidase MepM/ murein hydrolase activator NlpD
MMRRGLWIGLLITLLLIGTYSTAQDAPVLPTVAPIPTPVQPVPVEVLNGTNVTAELYTKQVKQGDFAVVRLTGDIVEARALLLNMQYNFLPFADGWYAFVVATIDMRPRDYNLSILVRDSQGVDSTLQTTITVTDAGFINQAFNFPADRAYLTDPEVERNEFAKLDAIVLQSQPTRLWDDNGFILPFKGEVLSAFGQYRVMNQNTQTRHTGWDFQAPIGTPVAAMARGIVVFAAHLDIRGNYVLIDHGYGIYTGYAHFSQFNVERGQTVEQGEVIGLVGNTGRSTGPHLHWEVAVNGEWVDGMDFLATWLPR